MLFSWQKGNHEIDVVIRCRNEAIGLEIKSSRSRALGGMELFGRLFDQKKVLLVGNSGIPWQEFLQVDPLELFRRPHICVEPRKRPVREAETPINLTLIFSNVPGEHREAMPAWRMILAGCGFSV
jgi:hypothetical protein